MPAGDAGLGRLARPAGTVDRAAAAEPPPDDDLHLRHDRPAQGRAAPPADAGAGSGYVARAVARLRLRGLRRAEDVRHRGHRADVPLGAQRLWPVRGARRRDGDPAAAVRPRGAAAAHRAHRVTHLHMVPIMFHRLLKLPDDGEAQVRPLVAEVRGPRRRALPAADQARR